MDQQDNISALTVVPRDNNTNEYSIYTTMT